TLVTRSLNELTSLTVLSERDTRGALSVFSIVDSSSRGVHRFTRLGRYVAGSGPLPLQMPDRRTRTGRRPTGRRRRTAPRPCPGDVRPGTQSRRRDSRPTWNLTGEPDRGRLTRRGIRTTPSTTGRISRQHRSQTRFRSASRDRRVEHW